MPLPKDKDHIDQDELNQVLMEAAKRDQKMAETYGFRLKQVDGLEETIIKELANPSSLRLSTDPSLLECMAVQNAGQSLLNRLTEIELQSIRIATKIRAHREAITNAILSVLGGSGSAESRRAKALKCVQTMNLLVTNEEGLLEICKTTRSNIRGAIEAASRSQTAIQNEIQFLGGAELHTDMIKQLRGNIKLQ